MSKTQIRISKDDARNKLEAQIEKARELCKNGIEIIKGIPSHMPERTRATDSFKTFVDQWQTFTFEILQEIFVSSSYAYDFEKKKSSKTMLVSSSWKPGIKYYIDHVIVPKADYLNVLLQRIDQFTVVEVHDQPAPPPANSSARQSEVSYWSLIRFWKQHWKWIIGTTIALIGLIWAIVSKYLKLPK